MASPVRFHWLFRSAFFAVVVFTTTSHAARLEVIEIPGVTLRDNPLGDPAARRAAVFVPEGAANDVPMPLVVYLPGWGGSSEQAIAHAGRDFLGQAVDALAAKGLSVRIATVDGRSRYGGSQFLNSSATGRYADYVSGEILPALLACFAPDRGHAKAAVIAGHSSGAYGALMLAMSEHAKFYAVVALSPDSNFEVTHKPLVQEPAVRAVTPADLEAAMAPAEKARLPADGLARLVMGLCANYAPVKGEPRRFEWLYDAKGQWREAAWQRWIALDPLTQIKRRPEAFAAEQRVYLDGAEHDEFGANIGARAMYEELRKRKSPVVFHETPGHHSEHLLERLTSGLSWALAH